MEPGILIDTDVIIWYMRGYESAAKFLSRHSGFRISAVTYIELIQGMRNKAELKSLRTALTLWKTPVLPIDEAISTQAMRLVESHFHSHALELADALIAATALHHTLPLATGNAKHYKVIKELKTVPFVIS